MSEINTFLNLFSDEAATPSKAFLDDLHDRYISATTGSNASFFRRVSKQKRIIIAATIAVIIAILALVFLPSRDMSDPTTNSLIETVVEQSQKNVETFTDTSTENSANTSSPTADNRDQQAPNNQQQHSNTSSTPTSPSSNISTPPPAVPAPLSGFLAQYWNLDIAELAGPPTIPAGVPALSNTTSLINFNWGTGSPDATVQNDGFVARYTKESAEIIGTYKVTFSSDNGLRMHVNETVVFDRWLEAAPSGVAYFTTDPAVPVTSITIEYYELDGPANVSVTITKQYKL